MLRTKFESPQSWLNYRSGFGTVVDRYRWEGGCIAEHVRYILDLLPPSLVPLKMSTRWLIPLSSGTKARSSPRTKGYPWGKGRKIFEYPLSFERAQHPVLLRERTFRLQICTYVKTDINWIRPP